MMTNPDATVGGTETSCDTSARNFSPLVLFDEEDDVPPHEIRIRPPNTKIDSTIAALLKRETPKSMMDKDLEAKLRIIAEPKLPP